MPPIYARYGKRLIDGGLALLALLLLAPLMALLAIGVRISSPGPAIFRQKRVGRDGKLFTFYKFRSMPVNVGDIPSHELGTVEMRPFGRFIRRTNLDELPQIFNILEGSMSFVGPRPPLASQEDLLVLRRASGALSCRPGLTGLAQVNSFDGMSVDQKACYDGQYADGVSLALDIWILLKTIGYLRRSPPRY